VSTIIDPVIKIVAHTPAVVCSSRQMGLKVTSCPTYRVKGYFRPTLQYLFSASACTRREDWCWSNPTVSTGPGTSPRGIGGVLIPCIGDGDIEYVCIRLGEMGS